MIWIVFALGAAVSWGLYGAMLHQGQVKLGNPMRAMLCVGVAYFLIGVLVPVAWLWSQGALTGGFNSSGATTATIAGASSGRGRRCALHSRSSASRRVPPTGDPAIPPCRQRSRNGPGPARRSRHSVNAAVWR